MVQKTLLEAAFQRYSVSKIALPRQVQLCCGSLNGVPILTTVSHVRVLSRTQHSANLQLSGEEGSQVDYDVKRQDLSCEAVDMGLFGC